MQASTNDEVKGKFHEVKGETDEKLRKLNLHHAAKILLTASPVWTQPRLLRMICSSSVAVGTEDPRSMKGTFARTHICHPVPIELSAVPVC